MDKKRILKDYDVNYPEFRTLSRFGPVKSIKTIVTRKSDNKVMGEVVAFRSYGGWLIGLLPAENTGKDCPNNKSTTEAKLHAQFVKEIFKVN